MTLHLTHPSSNVTDILRERGEKRVRGCGRHENPQRQGYKDKYGDGDYLVRNRDERNGRGGEETWVARRDRTRGSGKKSKT